MKIANKILNSEITNITILRSSKRSDVNIIAILLCELHFTSKFKRCVEYLYWSVLSVIRPQQRDLISVGIGQIQVRHWIKHDFIKPNNLFDCLRKFQNPLLNYDLIYKIFEEYNFDTLGDNQIIAIYRGEVRTYHLNLFQSLKKKLNARYG